MNKSRTQRAVDKGEITMAKKKTTTIAKALAQKAKIAGKERYVLRLYVAGMTPRSSQAIKNIMQICKDNLQGRYDLRIIDIYQQPTLAGGEQIIATPTLVKKLPLPLRKFIGSMGDNKKILLGMDLLSKKNK
jgi:circadian clock protein KaiB